MFETLTTHTLLIVALAAVIFIPIWFGIVYRLRRGRARTMTLRQWALLGLSAELPMFAVLLSAYHGPWYGVVQVARYVVIIGYLPCFTLSLVIDQR